MLYSAYFAKLLIYDNKKLLFILYEMDEGYKKGIKA